MKFTHLTRIAAVSLGLVLAAIPSAAVADSPDEWLIVIGGERYDDSSRVPADFPGRASRCVPSSGTISHLLDPVDAVEGNVLHNPDHEVVRYEAAARGNFSGGRIKRLSPRSPLPRETAKLVGAATSVAA